MDIKLNQPVEPDIIKLTNYLKQVHENGWYTNFGPLHQKLTKRLEEYLGVENLLLVSNGTLALQVAYKVLNVKKALTTPFSFVATASSLIWQDVDVSFSDVERYSYNLCPEKSQQALDVDSEIDTIVATHVYGNPCDVAKFEDIAKKKNVRIIYDAAHAFGVKIEGKSVLNFGDASTLSFHATKIFHTVEGGAVVFKNRNDYQLAKRLINFGINSEDGKIREVGINAKLNEYQCAVGLTLLDEIDDILACRSRLINIYRDGLRDIVDMPTWDTRSSLNGAYMPIKLSSNEERKFVEATLKKNNIQSRHYFSPSLDRVFSENFVHSNENSNALTDSILCLPLHFYMTIEDVNRVVAVVKKALKK
ncbi:DegT/DnrJ/EryC1/StrS family aminotransferase [Corallincola holothuriorum]|uniref:DegT/DnrJ/EryC1/StrS family aminotransferase n=1 Tax=Corallincola holothuriorum TaxID=2282215 RepID=A0A368N225_9GAMM|nr:DegT/DnrJ/EryC1/StrS family aminotransferase [Corallincola holothuriorum]RCU43299.1 DegT/DnrJ/EryC1/StrS family aminotransferase [Corallincola holothuriorum]